MKKNILIFSEEYVKITKGMFHVLTNHAQEASKTKQINILLNREHWGFEEACEFFKNNSSVKVHRLLFNMPATFLMDNSGMGDGNVPFRAARFALGKILTFIFAPFVCFYLLVCLRRMKIDAVFSHNGGWPAGNLGRWIILAATFARIPRRILVIHSHPAKMNNRVLALFFSPVMFLQARLLDYYATSVVAVSDSVKASLESEIFRKPITRIYNGILLSTENIHSSPLEWNPSETTVVGFVGALSHHKGAHVLLDAFKLVRFPCELALLGPSDSKYLSLLRQKAELCSNKVSFLGFQQDVETFMEKIDILVVPSVAYESFGLVILEAMKHKKPVICSDFGGMKEVVKDGVTGLVVPAGNEVLLSGAILKLLADSELRTKMGNAGFHRLVDLFTVDKMEFQYDLLS